MERLAVRVSAKIEDGDVRGAVRLAASDDMIATYCQETIDELSASTHALSLHHSIQQQTYMNHLNCLNQSLRRPSKVFKRVQLEDWMA